MVRRQREPPGRKYEECPANACAPTLETNLIGLALSLKALIQTLEALTTTGARVDVNGYCTAIRDRPPSRRSSTAAF